MTKNQGIMFPPEENNNYYFCLYYRILKLLSNFLYAFRYYQKIDLKLIIV